MPWEWQESGKTKKSGRGEKRSKYTELDTYQWVSTAPGEINMKLAEEPDGDIAQSIQETEQDYTNVHVAEKRWSSDRLQRFVETQKNVKNEIPEDPAKTPTEGVEAGGSGQQKNEAAVPIGQAATGAAAASAGV